MSDNKQYQYVSTKHACNCKTFFNDYVIVYCKLQLHETLCVYLRAVSSVIFLSIFTKCFARSFFFLIAGLCLIEIRLSICFVLDHQCNSAYVQAIKTARRAVQPRGAALASALLNTCHLQQRIQGMRRRRIASFQPW